MGTSGLLQDLRYAVRTLARQRAFAAVAVLTLAVGIGATTAIVSVVHGVLLRPLPYPAADELVMVFRTAPRFGFTRSVASYPDFADWRERATVFTGLAAYRPARATVTGPAGAERWDGYRATADLWRILGVAPALGRAFTAGEDRPGAAAVIVLGDGLWRSRFGSDRAVIGRTVTLDGTSHTVVGVMPPGFDFPSDGTQYWVPLRGDAEQMERDANFLTVIGRLASNVTLSRAAAELEAIVARIDAEAPNANEGYGVFLEPRHAFVVRNARTALLLFLGAVGLVLAIACANVANLMLARGTARTREVAVRSALGAGRGRLVRQLLTESAVLGMLGGALGLGVALALLRILVAIGAGHVPRLHEASLNGVVLAVTAALSLGCGLVFGAIPAWLGGRPDAARTLREGGPAPGLGRLGRRFQRGLVIAQVALAVVLSVGAALLLRSFARLTAVEPGFDPRHVTAARVAPPQPELDFAPGTTQEQMIAITRPFVEARSAFFERLQRDLAALPGVEAVGLGYGLPFGEHSYSRIVVPDAMAVVEGEEPVLAGNVVAGDYFRALGIPLRRGRTFDAGDRVDAAPVVIVSEAMAAAFWPGEDAVGKRVRIGNDAGSVHTVIGIVADVHQQSLAQNPEPMFYRPLAQATWPDGMFAIVRAPAPGAGRVEAIRSVVAALDPALPVTDVAVATELIARSVSAPRFRTFVLGVFGSAAVVLAVVGVYGVIAYTVGARRREFGIRLALGAAPRRVVRLVLYHGVALAAIGVGVGLAGALAASRLLESFLFGTAPWDPLTFAGVAVVLTAVTALAGYVPARRAAASDPLESLRAE